MGCGLWEIAHLPSTCPAFQDSAGHPAQAWLFWTPIPHLASGRRLTLQSRGPYAYCRRSGPPTKVPHILIWAVTRPLLPPERTLFILFSFPFIFDPFATGTRCTQGASRVQQESTGGYSLTSPTQLSDSRSFKHFPTQLRRTSTSAPPQTR